MQEQSDDVLRQQRLKVLAADADRRWAAKPSFMDAPAGRAASMPVLDGVRRGGAQRIEGDRGANTARVVVGRQLGDGVGGGVGLKDSERPQDVMKDSDVRTPISAAGIESEDLNHEEPRFSERSDSSRAKEEKYKEDPWKQARGAPSEEWQPQAWSPNTAAGRR